MKDFSEKKETFIA